MIEVDNGMGVKSQIILCLLNINIHKNFNTEAQSDKIGAVINLQSMF
jgi:hypothetical protein